METREDTPAPAYCVLPDERQVTRLAAVAKALGDPIRLRMLALMAKGRSCCGLPDAASRGVPGAGEPHGVCVCEFQEQLGLGQSKSSYHLRVLRDAGLITEETRGKWSFYALDEDTAAAAFRELSDLFKLAE
jgi:ArsR family transcriptional regulator, arsenate/arsenite/antimonite-responsive transcriptional repressor